MTKYFKVCPRGFRNEWSVISTETVEEETQLRAWAEPLVAKDGGYIEEVTPEYLKRVHDHNESARRRFENEIYPSTIPEPWSEYRHIVRPDIY